MAVDKTKNLANDLSVSEATSSLARIKELEKELQLCRAELKSNSSRINKLLNLVVSYAQLEFKDKVIVTEKRDEIDALGACLVILGEQLKSKLSQSKESQQQFHRLVDGLSVGVLLQDKDARILISNPTAFELLGLTEAQLIGKTSFDPDWKVTHEDGTDFPGPEHPVPRAIATLTQVKDEIMVVYRPLKDDWVWLQVSALPLLNESGELKEVICSFIDITRQKQNEKELLDTRTQYQSLLDLSPSITYRARAYGDFGVNYISENIKKQTGYEPADFLNDSGFWLNHIHPDDTSRVIEALDNIHGNDVCVLEYRFKHKNGLYRWMHDEFRQIRVHQGNTKEIIGSWIDIHTSKVYEEKIVASERMLANSQAIAHIGSWVRDVATGNLDWSDELYRIYGIPPQSIKMSYDLFLNRVHPEDKESEINRIEKALKTGQGDSYHLKIIKPSGEVRTLHCQLQPVRDSQGKVASLTGTCTDITERELMLKEMNILALIAKKTDNSVILTDNYGKIDWVNNAFERLTEYSIDEILGKNLQLLYGEATDRSTVEYMETQIAKGEGYQCEIEKYSKTGRRYWVVIHGQPILDEKGNVSHFFNIETDFTKNKLAYQKLEKMESETRGFARHLHETLEQERIRIAREIHDELGQQLVGVKMSISSLKQFYENNEPVHQLVKNILKDTDNTIRSIRKITLELRPALLDSLGLFDAIEWLVMEFGLRTEIKFDHEIEKSDKVYDKDISICYYRICQEALTNIVKHSQASIARVCLFHQDNNLVMIISDNGKGITENLEPKMSLGIIGMMERAHLIGAQFKINRLNPHGTKIELTVQI